MHNLSIIFRTISFHFFSVPTTSGFLQHYNMACDYYRLGLKPVTRMAHEAGAVYKIGKKVLIRRSIFEAYLREQRSVERSEQE